MCGIVGFSGTVDNSASVLSSMMNRIIHRGPDSLGKYQDENMSLGFVRLSIIDLSEAATPPIFNEDNNMCVLLNGEIYNYRQLRTELQEDGHIFKTKGDTEVLVHMYEKYGRCMLNRLRGMFAVAIYDKTHNELFLARDFFGIKPMYYAIIEGQLVFASEIKAFFEYPGFTARLNTEALSQFLSFQYSVLPETFFKGVYRLLPGHFLVYKNGECYIEKYYAAQFCADGDNCNLSIEEAADAVDKTVCESIEAHMVADVPVGSFLSSGVDSSYVAVAAGVDKTFTVGFSFDKYNETVSAKKLTEWNKGDKGGKAFTNHSRIITDDEYWKALPKVQYHMDEPLADPSAVALYFVSREAAKHVKVALSGEAADEFFGGYNIYKEPIDLSAVKKLPAGLRKVMAKCAGSIPFSFKGKDFLRRASVPLEKRYIGNAYMFTKKERMRILKSDSSAAPSDITKPLYDEANEYDDVTKMQYIDINLWMPGDILLKADRMSMAHSLEARVPLVDKHVFETASALPTRLKVTKEGTKLAFRRAASKHIPEFAAQKKKLGFPVPIRLWLREDDYYEKIKAAFISDAAEMYFNTEELMKLLDAHKQGKRDNSRKIWTVYMFLVWYDVFFVNLRTLQL